MGLFGRSKLSAGLDIGSGIVKLVVIDHSKPEPEIVQVATSPLVPDAIVEGEVMDPVLVAETVREQVLEHTHAELPFSTAVVVDEFDESDRERVVRLYCTIYVEHESQKPIVIGRGGGMIKRIGTEARQELEAILGARVFLDLHVGVHELWREDERFLGELEWPLKD